MNEMINSLAEEVNSLSINNIKDKIRNKIYKEIEKLRKDDDQFSKELERLENGFLQCLLEIRSSNLKYLINLYNSLNSLEIGINNFKDKVNIN